MSNKYELFLDKNKKVKLHANEAGEFFIDTAGGTISALSDGSFLVNGEAAGGGGASDLDSVLTIGNTSKNDITVNSVTQSKAKLMLEPQYAGQVSSVTQETVAGPEISALGYPFAMTRIDMDTWELAVDPGILDLFGGTTEDLIGLELTIEGNDGQDFTLSGTVSGYLGGSDRFSIANAVMNPPDYINYFVDYYATSFLFGSSVTLDVIQIANAEPIAENVDYMISKSATQTSFITDPLNGGQILYSEFYYLVTNTQIDGWESGAPFTLIMNDGSEMLIYADWWFEPIPGENIYYYNPSVPFDAYSVIGIKGTESYAEAYSVEVTDDIAIIKTANTGFYSANDHVYLHQSKSKIQVLDTNFEPLNILTYNRVTGETTSKLSNFIDADSQEKFIDTGRLSNPAIMLLSDKWSESNFPAGTNAYGSIVLSGGGIGIVSGDFAYSTIIGGGVSLGAGMTGSVLIGSDISNEQNYSADGNIVVGKNVQILDGYTGNNSNGSFGVLIGNGVRTARPYSNAIGNGVSVFDSGATSVGRPWTYEYNVGSRNYSRDLSAQSNLYLAKYAHGSGGNWTSSLPSIADYNLKYLFNTKMMNDRSSYYNDSCMKVHVNGIWKDKTSGLPIGTDKTFIFWWNGSSWSQMSATEREGDSNWQTKITFVDTDNFVISIYNSSTATRKVYGVNLNVEVTFTT